MATPRTVGAGWLLANSKPNSSKFGGVRPDEVPPVSDSSDWPSQSPRNTSDSDATPR
jgi:hypothetical protein